MANLGFLFDANRVEPSAPLEVIPPGDYVVTIVNSEMRETANRSGRYLWLEEVIEEGEYKGRRLWDRLNLENSNAQAVEIAERTFSAICHAVGVMQVDDSEKLHHRRLIAVVKVRPAGPDKSGVQREAQNEIKGYKPVAGTGQQAQHQRQAPQQPQQQAAPAQSAPRSATPPWRKQA